MARLPCRGYFAVVSNADGASPIVGESYVQGKMAVAILVMVG